ncbi:MAG: hydrolase 1, exosortase A system-associated [Gammaproteobacteria bacterium]|nr:hydrolase 1, exosortase A system-associated [Pseudomonadales bacterium]
MVVEEATVFECQGENLIGIIHRPQVPEDVGVLVVVGGPQYRVGSHRQFLLLARYLADSGIAVMRFDYRGMGDSGGLLREFETIDDDICAAIDHFSVAVPPVKRIVIWGLCDASSAALFYAHTDSRVAGLVLLNPWVRTAQGEAEAYVKQYYVSRLANKAFWFKLLRGKVSLWEAYKSLFGNIWSMFFGNKTTREEGENGLGQASLPDRMFQGLRNFNGGVLIILSGKDLTADEFKNLVSHSRAWQQQLKKKNVTVSELPEANHTFSSHSLRHQVQLCTRDWLMAEYLVKTP